MLALAMLAASAAGNLPLVELSDSSGAVVLRAPLAEAGEWSVETGPLKLALEAALVQTGGNPLLEGTLTGRTGAFDADDCAFGVVVIEGQGKSLICTLQDPPALYLDGSALTRLSYTVDLRWVDGDTWAATPEALELLPLVPGGGLALSMEAPPSASQTAGTEGGATEDPGRTPGLTLLTTGYIITGAGMTTFTVGLVYAISSPGLFDGLGYGVGAAGIALPSSRLWLLNPPLVITGLAFSSVAFGRAYQLQRAPVSLTLTPTPDGLALHGWF